MNKLRVGGILSIIPFVLIVLISIPPVTPDYFPVKDIEQDLVDAEVSKLLQNSVVDTDFIFTESDDSYLARFLDDNDIGFSDKFAIKTDVSLIDSNSNKISSTDIFGVSQLPTNLSVLDKDGNPLDEGGLIQVTFDSVSQDIPKSYTSWGTVKFFLDDKEIATKNIWSNSIGSQIERMSVLDSLQMRKNQNNVQIDSQVNILQQQLKLIPIYSESQRIDFANSIGVSYHSVEGLTAYLNSEIVKLNAKKSIINDFPNPPTFSEREKKNFTFDFNDEGLSDGSHFFRVVLYDVNAVVDFENFNFKGENIVYELEFIVDNNKITKSSETLDEKQSIYKSDNRFVYVINQASTKKYTIIYPDVKAFYSPIMTHNIKIFVNDELIKIIDKSTTPFEFMFARDSQLKVIVDDKTVYDQKVPLSQVNHYIALSSNISKVHYTWGSCGSSGGSGVFSHGTVSGFDGTSVITSSVGYSDTVSSPIGSGQPYPCY